MIDFTPQPFNPAPYLRNAHIQTVLSTFMRHSGKVSFRRVRIDTPDGDFLDLDFAEVPNYSWAQLGEAAPILLMLHGLDGTARNGYTADMYQLAAAAGIRPVGLNYRSCSGEMNRTPKLYHLGSTEDVAFVHEWLEAQFPNAPIVMCGVSLGGSIILKYLGENGAALQGRLVAACSVSPPFDVRGKQALQQGVAHLYELYLLHGLNSKVRQKIGILKHTAADPYRSLTATSLTDYDDAIIAPLHGFDSAQDYYEKCSAVNFMADVRVPTFVTRALDDPFFNPDTPFEIIAANPYLMGYFPEHGGHVGFMQGFSRQADNNWAATQSVAFLRSILDSSTQTPTR